MKKKSCREVFKPIHFSARQVGLMVRVAAFFNPNLFEKIGAESQEEVEFCASLIAGGCPASPAIQRYFGLRQEGKGYVWNLR